MSWPHQNNSVPRRPLPLPGGPDARVLEALRLASGRIRQSPIAAYARRSISQRSPLVLTSSADAAYQCAQLGYQVLQVPEWICDGDWLDLIKLTQAHLDGVIVLLTGRSLFDWDAYRFGVLLRRFSQISTRISFWQKPTKDARSLRKALECSCPVGWDVEHLAIQVMKMVVPQAKRPNFLQELARFTVRVARRRFVRDLTEECLTPNGINVRIFKTLLRQERKARDYNEVAKAVECGLCA